MSASPAFQFYPAEFLADENVVMMSNWDLGCYIKMICYCWREGSIPSEPAKLARLLNEDSSAIAQLSAHVWLCFRTATNDEKRLIHPRLEREKSKQRNYAKERAESGKKGGNARWNKGLQNHSSAIAQLSAVRVANHGSSSSSSINKEGRKTTLPADFEISEAVRDWAIALGITSLDRHLVHFRDIALAKDYRYVDWDRAFMRAIRDNWAKVPTPPRPSTRVAL